MELVVVVLLQRDCGETAKRLLRNYRSIIRILPEYCWETVELLDQRVALDQLQQGATTSSTRAASYPTVATTLQVGSMRFTTFSLFVFLFFYY